MSTLDAAPPRPRTVFANAHFRNLWLGGAVSAFGDQFYLVALPWLVLQLTGSNLAVGTVLMCAAIPRAVLMLGGGAVSDRIAPRRIMLTTASTRTIFVGAVGLLVWLHIVQLWHLGVLAFAFGIAAAFFIDAVSFLFILALIYGLPRTQPVPKPRAAGKHFGHDILEGLHYVWRDAAMRGLLVLMTGGNLCISGPIIVGLAALGKFRFGSPTAFGVLISAWSGGALLGSITAGTRKQRTHRGWTMILASAAVAVGIAAIGVLHGELAMGIVLAASGVVGGYNNVVLISWFQQRVEHALMGRVMSVLMFGWVGLMPVSYPIAGALAQWSIGGMFLISGLTAVVITALCALSGELRRVE